MTTISIHAIYRDGVLKLDDTLNLPNDTPVQVQVTPLNVGGESSDILSKIISEPGGAESGSFWNGNALSKLIERQGVRPVARLSDLRADFWTASESVDDLIDAVRTWRHQDSLN